MKKKMFLVAVATDCENHHQLAMDKVRDTFSNHLQPFYHNLEIIEDGDPGIIQAQTPDGFSHIEEAIQQTQERNAERIEKIANLITESESYEEAAGSHDLAREAFWLGRKENPEALLIDATSWTRGLPIRSLERCQEVLDHTESNNKTPYLVQARCTW